MHRSATLTDPNRAFSYPPLRRVGYILATILTTALALFAAIRTVGALFLALQGDLSALGEMILIPATPAEAAALSLAASLGLWLFPAVFSNLRPNLVLDKKGIRVQTFLFWWRLVPWQDVIELKPTLFAYVFPNHSFCVVTRNLTVLHRLLSLMYCLTARPSFLIWSDITGFNMLLDLLQHRKLAAS